LETIPIEFPPLAKQVQIVRLLDKADELRRLRSHSDRRISSLIPALFDEMIGDPTSNPKGWEMGTVGDVTSFITSGSRGWAAYYSEQGPRFIRVQNLAGHRLCLEDVAYVTPPRSAESTRTRIQPDDLLLAITGNTIGLSALASADLGEAYVNQHVAILRLNEKVVPIFMACFMALPAGGQRHIAEIQYGQTKPGISLEQIRAIPVPIPPLPVQIQFAMRVTKIYDLEANQGASSRCMEDLYKSLLHRAFRGEL
jgi:type I restriction enzyme S subunit